MYKCNRFKRGKKMRYLTPILLIWSTASADWTPSGHALWSDSTERKQIYGQGAHNYPKDDNSWAEIDDRWIESPDSIYCKTAILQTTISSNGRTKITIKDGNEFRTVTQRLMGVGWISKANWNHSRIGDVPSFDSPTVDSNKVDWSDIIPGVDYRVTKVHAGVGHQIRLSPAFLDNAVAFYDTRVDSLQLGLANIFRYTFDNMDGDSAVGDVEARRFLTTADKRFGLTKQHLFYPGWDDTTNAGELINPLIEIRQYWKWDGPDLLCIEWVSMKKLKWAHDLFPDSVIYHNVRDSLETSDTDFRDVLMYEGSTGSNFGGADFWWTGEDSGGDQLNMWWWANFTQDATATVSEATLTMTFYQDGSIDDDSLVILPADTTIQIGDTLLANQEGVGVDQGPTTTPGMTWNNWYDTSGTDDDIAWDDPGGDWHTDDTIGVDSILGTGTHEFALDISYVEEWMDGRKNEGAFVVTKNRAPGEDSRYRVRSSEFSSVGSRPFVVVVYTTGGAADDVYVRRRKLQERRK